MVQNCNQSDVSDVRHENLTGPLATAPFESDWYTFVLQELNGLGTMWRHAGGAHGPDGLAIALRIHTLLAALAWNRTAATKHARTFVDKHLDDPEDAWGPYLVLRALAPGPDDRSLTDWLRSLPADARAAIANTPAFPEEVP